MAGQQEIETNDDKQKHEQQMLKDILEKVKQIYVQRSLTMPEYMKLYSNILTYCIKYKELNFWVYEKDTHTNCCYKRLCNEFKTFLDEHIATISANLPESDQDETCLKNYCVVWNQFRWSSRVLNGAAAYLNKQHHKKDPEAQSVEQIVFQTWREHVFNHLNDKVANAALRMLKRSRNGEYINADAIRAVVESYLELGVLESPSESDDITAHLSVYKEFERRVLQGTIEFYEIEGVNAIEKYCIEQKSFVSYMEYVTKRIEEEMKDCVKLLHCTTVEPLMNVLTDNLIDKHSKLFESEFQEMLQRDKNDDLALTFSLAIKSNVMLKQLNAIFEEHVTKEGSDQLEKCANEAVKDPKLYIDTIMSVYNKYDGLVKNQFKNEIGFMTALDKACSKFINKNAVIDLSGDTNKSAELLAQHCHMLLKKSNKNLDEESLEEALNQSLIVFRFIEDKDIFEVFYKKRLAERLIEQLSASDDAEASMISKMKHACGYNYTNKLQRMYQDIEVSKGINEKFRNRISSSTPMDMDFRIQILTQGSWPFKQSMTFTKSIEFESAINRFTDFYNSEQSGRKLMWLFNRSKGELIMRTIKNNYFIKANTFQMAMLLQFNEQLSYTVKQIHENTGIDKKYTEQMLSIMVEKVKLLKSTDHGKINEHSVIEFNTNFNGAKLRFDISTIRLKFELVTERKSTNHDIEEDRRHLIDAAIVRVMKMRKTLNHQSLIGEVITQLSAKFKPKIPAIKKCIDLLIEKDYLERHPTEIQTYNYLA